MKILKKPEVSSSVGLVLGAAGVIVGLAGVLGVVYGNFFQEHQTLVLIISAIIGLLALVIMMGAMWHFVEPLKNKFTKPLFSKKLLCRLLERSFIKLLRSGWVEDFCKKREIFFLIPRENKNPNFVENCSKRLERDNIHCNFIDYTKEIRKELEKCQSHEVIIVLYEGIEAEKWLIQQLRICKPLEKIIVVCNTTKYRLHPPNDQPELFKGVKIIDDCSIGQLLPELVK